MKLEFSGAALGVTGSKHLLHINGHKVLLDCGLFQGRRKQSILANLKFPFAASSIDALVLSHAHIDHSGAIPILVKNGFRGPIYCTLPTKDLCEIMLRDAAYIQERDSEWIKKKTKSIYPDPLYTIADAERALKLFQTVDYEEAFSPVPGTKVIFHDAGHILGSAMEEWEIDDEDIGKKVRFGFTGDLGRQDLPILKNPKQLENLDILITESTYGNRLHDEISDVEERFAKEINECIARKGKILIPSFAVERTQEILYILRRLEQAKKITTPIPIFVDSPLATSATEIFRRHTKYFDKQFQALLESGEDPFCPEGGTLQFTQSVEESKALNNFPGPMMIISASGMCEAGRIRHHLANNIENPNTLILIVGYMAQNTLGRKLVEKESPVNIFGEPRELRAEVQIFNAFSAHADQSGLLKFSEDAGKPKALFCVHGEEEIINVFEGKLKELKNLQKTDIFVPRPGDIFEINKDKTWRKSEEFNAISRSLFAEELSEVLSAKANSPLLG